MKKYLLFYLFLCIGITTYAQDANSEVPIMRTKPYLQNPSPDGMTVTWVTNALVNSWVEYGEDPNDLNQKAQTLVDGQVVCYNKLHNIRLSKLKPNTTYYYQAFSQEIKGYGAYSKDFGETEKTKVYKFTTPGTETKDFTALIFNDIHKQKKTLNALMDQVGDTKYDFVVFNGDFIDDPNNENDVLDILSYAVERVNASEHPIYLLRGNHEIRGAYSIRLRDYIDYVGGNTTYGAFNWGDTRFVLLDCGEDKPDDHWVYYGLNNFEQFRLDQVEFLEKELKSKDFKKANKRVLIHHIPIYGGDDEYVPCRELWHPLLSKAKFNVAITGHTHSYQYLPVGADINTFPAVIGGGYDLKSATVMILSKNQKDLKLKVINPSGNELLNVDL